MTDDLNPARLAAICLKRPVYGRLVDCTPEEFLAFVRELRHGIAHKSDGASWVNLILADTCEYLLAVIARFQAEQTEKEQEIRRVLWLNHGHSSVLYGDDGEMQCNARHGKTGVFIDFKRDGLGFIIVALMSEMRQLEADVARLQAERDEQDREAAQAAAILEGISDALDGQALSDFLLSFPLVRAVDDLRNQRDDAITRRNAADAARDEAQHELNAMKLERTKRRVNQ